MRYFAVLSVLLSVILAQPIHARTVTRNNPPQPHDGSTPWVRFPPSAAKALVDTTYILGGPGSWNGSFETPGGQPDWHGWTHEDLSVSLENHWHVSTYMADQITGKGPGNHAMYCGDETLTACDPPDTIGGYGDNWLEDIEWRQVVADPGLPVTVQLTGTMNFDTEPSYDYLYLLVQRGEGSEVLATWDGKGTAALDLTTEVLPGDFTGPGNNEVRLIWRFQSDTAYSDFDCLWPTRGACQIDDLTVYLNGLQATFDDFEPGNPVNWVPASLPGVGDFASLRNNLNTVYSCPTENSSYQVNFVDDGIVVPGTGGTPCIDWCYGPGGYILNHEGGLMADFWQDFHLNNQVVSPALALPANKDGALLSFDVYVHEPFTAISPGMFGFWQVRSTASSDPADLQDAAWQSRNILLLDSEGTYLRKEEPVGDLLVPNGQWVQIALSVVELGFQLGLNGPNGTPGPYFDNVAFKVWDLEGPDFYMDWGWRFGDAFPEVGALDPIDLAANSCRLDMYSTDAFGEHNDAMVVRVTPLRKDAIVTVPPELHWTLKCNPVFDSVRPSSPDPQGILRGSTSGFMDPQNFPAEWSFDLPDTGFFYPGDLLRFYITASDELDGDLRTSVWPADTTGVLNFTPSSTFSLLAEARALPTVTQPAPGQFSNPSILFYDNLRNSLEIRDTWFGALQELGIELGIGFDVIRPSNLTHLGPANNFSYYQTMIRPQQRLSSHVQSDEVQLVFDWLDTGGKNFLLAGNDALYSGAFSTRMGVQYHSKNIGDFNGGVRDLQVSPVTGNGVLPDGLLWLLDDGCPLTTNSDAISAIGDGQASATLDLQGNIGGPYAALITVDDQVLGNRTAAMPFDLARGNGMTPGSAKAGSMYSPGAYLLSYLLAWFDSEYVSSVGDLPGLGQVSVTAHPNPFNPSTTIAFDLPRAMDVSLDIYDLQGRLVRRLLDESPHISGSHKQVWDGRNSGGQTTASGVYFYRFTAGDQKRVGKLTLLL